MNIKTLLLFVISANCIVSKNINSALMEKCNEPDLHLEDNLEDEKYSRAKKAFAKDHPKEMAFFEAIGTEDEKIIVELLPKIDVNIKDWAGMTPLMEAADLGLVNIVRLLLQQSGIRINETDNLGDTALHYAKSSIIAEDNEKHAIKELLISAGIDQNISHHNISHHKNAGDV